MFNILESSQFNFDSTMSELDHSGEHVPLEIPSRTEAPEPTIVDSTVVTTVPVLNSTSSPIGVNPSSSREPGKQRKRTGRDRGLLAAAASSRMAGESGTGETSPSSKDPPISHTLEGQRRWTRYSSMAAPMLDDIHNYWGVPRIINLSIPGPSDTYDFPADPRHWVVTADLFRWGLRLPATAFINAFFKAVKRAPGQLVPNGWLALTAFQVACAAARVNPTINLFLRFFYVRHDGCVVEVHSRGAQVFISGRKPKNDMARWLRRWFLVDGGFDEGVPKRFAGGAYPTAALYDGIDADMTAVSEVFGGKLPRAIFLDEEVLSKARISPLAYPAETFGNLVYFSSSLFSELAGSYPSLIFSRCPYCQEEGGAGTRN